MDADAGEQPRFTLADEGSFLRLRWAAGITMGADDVHSTIEAVNAASPGGRRPLLVNIGLLGAVTAEARALLIEDTCSSRTAVVGVDEMGKVLTAFNYRAVTPSRYFTDEASALDWLMSAPGRIDPEHRADTQNAFDVWLDDDIMVVQWSDHVHVGVPLAEALVRTVEELGGDARFPLLSLCTSPVSATDEGAATIAAELDVVALALVGVEEDAGIASFYRNLHSPQYAIGYFGTVAEARRWLVRAPRT